MTKRVIVCDCPNCPCGDLVDREGRICEGCKSSERCKALNGHNGKHKWVESDGSAWSQYSYVCLACLSRVGSRVLRTPHLDGCNPRMKAQRGKPGGG